MPALNLAPQKGLLYFTKGNDVYAYNRRTKQKMLIKRDAFVRQAGNGYYLKRDRTGRMQVFFRSLRDMRANARRKRSANAAKRKGTATSMRYGRYRVYRRSDGTLFIKVRVLRNGKKKVVRRKVTMAKIERRLKKKERLLKKKATRAAKRATKKTRKSKGKGKGKKKTGKRKTKTSKKKSSSGKRRRTSVKVELAPPSMPM